MTPIEAYSAIQNFYHNKPKVRSCKKFINGYGFVLAPEDSDNDETIFIGGTITCVNDNGEIIERSMFEKLPFTIKEIDVKIFS